MIVRVRPFHPSDYPRLVKIRSEAEGDRHTVEEARARDERWDHARYEKARVVAQDEEGVVIGYGEIYQDPSRFEPGRYFIRLAVEERWRGRGVGSALWDHVAAELDERGARIASIWADEGPASRAFLERRDFRIAIRGIQQVLEVARFDAAPFAGAVERVEAQGIAIADLASEMRADRHALRKAHGLYFSARADQPTLGRVTAGPFEDWVYFNVESPQALTDAYFIAKDGDRYVGCASLWRRAPGELHVGITAVLPSHRRRGIALALKLRTIDYAGRDGAERIVTSVTDRNRAMVALNERLGFRSRRTWAGYERECGVR